MSQYPSPHSSDPHYDDSNLGTPGVAIAALITGITGICFFPCAVAALICGIVGMKKATNGRPGHGLALAGTILGGVGMMTSVVALLIAILLPALGAARRTAQRMQNSTQIRGIHQGLVTYATSNRNNFAGLNSKGQILSDGIETGNSGDGNTPQARMWILLEGDFFSPAYAISPSETDAAIVEHQGPGTGPVIGQNYSYAMLSFVKDGSQVFGTPPAYAIANASAQRGAEWKQTLNSQAVVLSDRNTGANANTGVQGIHSNAPGKWSGSVLWNDNHVGFETQPMFETKYGAGMLNVGPSDHLFIDEPAQAGQPQGANALLVHDTVK